MQSLLLKTDFLFRTFDYYLNNQEFAETYFQAHLRASPFLIGMVAAYIYHLLKRNNTKIPKVILKMEEISEVPAHRQVNTCLGYNHSDRFTAVAIGR